MIFHDPRVGSKQQGHRHSHDIADLLTALGMDVQPNMMQAGDFAFFGNGPDGALSVGIELKKIEDLVTSMRTGRLAEQVQRMLEQYQRVYIIVEGVYRARWGSGLLEVPRGRRWLPLGHSLRPIRWADVEKYIVGLEEAGVRVRRTRSSNETVQMIVSLYLFWEKPYDEHRSLQGIYRAPMPMALVKEDPHTRAVRGMLMGLPGIGYGRSKVVAEKFRSIYAAVNADVAAWQGIEGIGKTTAGDVCRFLRENIPGAQGSSARRVRKGHAVADRGVRHPRQRPSRRMAATRRTQSGVSQSPVRRRSPDAD